MTAVEVLTRARGLVSKGWCQGYWRVFWSDRPEPTYCLWGAMREADPKQPNETILNPAWTLVRLAIGTGDFAAWNDAEERTQADVLAAIDKAIEAASPR